MNKKHNEGFSLVELLVSIVILAAIVLPTCTSLVLSYRINAKATDMMQAQLAVSSTVETLMAKGITDDFLESLEDILILDESETRTISCTSSEYPGLRFNLTQKEEEPFFTVVVVDEEGLVPVQTNICDKTKDVNFKEVSDEKA